MGVDQGGYFLKGGGRNINLPPVLVTDEKRRKGKGEKREEKGRKREKKREKKRREKN